MKKESLKENIAKILGVSSLEKELAFEIFLEKITEVLDYDQAIKVNELGVFQLKKNIPTQDEISVIGSSDHKKDKIIYSAFDQKSSRESSSLFLSFDVRAKLKDDFEFDDEVFNPGVGKPILPINSDNDEIDSSIYLIKKSLEARVSELIEESEKLESFDIWDDFYKNNDKKNDDVSETEETNEMIDLGEPTTFEFDTKNSKESINELTEDENEKVESLLDVSINPSDELDEKETEEFFKANLEIGETDDESSDSNESFSQEEIDRLLNNVSAEEDNKFNTKDDDKDLSAFEKLTSFMNLDNNFENEAPEEDFDARKINDELDEDDPFATLEKTFSGEIDEQIDDVEAEIQDESPEVEGDFNFDLGNDIHEHIVEEHDETLNQENIEEANNSHTQIDSLESDVDEFNSDESKTFENTDPAKTIEFSPDDDFDTVPEDKTKKKYGLLFWGLVSVFILVTAFGAYFLFFTYDETSSEINNNSAAAIDSSETDSIVKPIVQKIDTSVVLNKPVIEKEIERKPETTLENKSISTNLNPADEVEVGNFIFTNGTQYSVQVSSWKNKSAADKEAERFNKLGYQTSVVTVQLKKLGTWYRVRVGYFESIEKAKNFQNNQK